jgi:hypothetical protein
VEGVNWPVVVMRSPDLLFFEQHLMRVEALCGRGRDRVHGVRRVVMPVVRREDGVDGRRRLGQVGRLDQIALIARVGVGRVGREAQGRGLQ